MPEIQRIVSITAAKYKPTEYRVELLQGNATLHSSSELIQTTLVSAMIYATSVEVEVTGSGEIHRVKPFGQGMHEIGVNNGKYRIQRVATQRKPDASDEHLEVFLVGNATAYNVYDSRVQQLIIAVFSHQDDAQNYSIDAAIKDGEIIAVAFSL